jgi:hypothetical protein
MAFEVEQRFAALERLVNKANEKGLDEEQASYLSRLGSVLVCGNIERCVEALVVNRVSANSSKQASAFLKSYFKRGVNYDVEAICQLLFKFDGEWGKKLERAIMQDVKESITSCYSVRNSVAHGGGGSLGPRTLRQYFEASVTLIAELEKAIR